MLDKYLISEHSSVLDALKTLNDLGSNEALTLFVKDAENKIIGSLTDGDIRRSLIKDISLDSPVGPIAYSNFIYLTEKVDGNVSLIHKAKSKGIEMIPILDANHCIVDVINLKKIKSFLPIDAVLMAGGKGERLRPLTEKTPKPLLPVGNKAIIDHNVDRLISYGIKHISVTVNYLKEQIEEHFAEPRNGIKINTVREPKFLGTMGSIKFVPNFYNDTVLVMNSDLFTNIDYEDFFLHFQQHDAEMSVAAVPYNVSIPLGIFELDGRNIMGLQEKPQFNYYANAGIYLIKRQVLDKIPQDTFFHATDLIEKLIEEKKTVIRYPLNGTWIDIGNPQEYQKAKELVSHI